MLRQNIRHQKEPREKEKDLSSSLVLNPLKGLVMHYIRPQFREYLNEGSQAAELLPSESIAIPPQFHCMDLTKAVYVSKSKGSFKSSEFISSK